MSEYEKTNELNLDEWGVTFEGGFWTDQGNIGREVSLGHQFTWGDEKWTAASAYICDEGLVVDYIVEINLGRFKAFLEKLKLVADDFENLSRVEQEKIENEQPMNFGFSSRLSCNGKMLEGGSSSSLCWIPVYCLEDECMNEIESLRCMRHYKLDEDKAWVFWRCGYDWDQKEDQLNSLEITFTRDKKSCSINPIGDLKAGSSAEIENPVTGQKHRITAFEVSVETYDKSIFNDPNMEYPTHFKAMEYSIEPDIDGRSFLIQDAVGGDSPRMKEQSPDGPVAIAASIIGGARGLTGISNKNVKLACSAMHFDEDFEVNWMPVFFVKEMEDIVVSIEVNEYDR